MSHTVQLDSRRATPALELAATVPAEVTAEMIAVISGPKGDTGDVNPLTIQANEQAQAAAASASTDAGVAATKAIEATNSATDAAASATAALASKNAAATSETNALASKNSASTSATTATTKASEASTSATNAAASATTASTKASEASTSATNAAASATAAATSATNTANALVGERSAVATLTNKTITSPVIDSGVANGVAYLNGSKVLTADGGLTFDGSNLLVGNVAGLGQPQRVQAEGSYLAYGDGAGFRAINETLTGGGGIAANAAAGDGITLSGDGGNIAFVAGGSEQMRLTSTGLGIGTSLPYWKLSVSDGVTQGGMAPNGGNLYFGTRSASPILFRTNDADRMTLDIPGNLGLGVVPSDWVGIAPSMQLGDYGNITSTGTRLWTGTNYYYNSGEKYNGTGSASRYRQSDGLHIWDTAPSGTAGQPISFTQAMTLDAGGDLRLRTDGGTARYFAGPTGAEAYFGYNSDGTAQINGRFGYAMLFSIGGSERARIDSGGNLLVGATAVSDQSKVRIAYDSGLNQGLIFTDSEASAGKDAVRFKVNDSTVGSISTSTTATTYNTSSDYRLKDITGPVANSGAYIDSLNPVEGTWKADGSTFVGLIAHEVQEASRTRVATGVKDGEQMQAMDYSSSELIANMIAELKSLRARVAALESI